MENRPVAARIAKLNPFKSEYRTWPRRLRLQLLQIRGQRQDSRNTVQAGHRQLERRPELRHLSKGHIEVVDVKQESDQSSHRRTAHRNQIETVCDHDELSQVVHQ